MSSPSRFSKVGLHGRKGTLNNQTDTFLQTIEIPINAIADATAQDSGVPLPGPNSVLVSAVIQVDVAEVTAVTKTVEVGIVGGTGSELMTGVDLSAIGWFGTPVAAPINAPANISFTLAGSDFVELKAFAILTFQSRA